MKSPPDSVLVIVARRIGDVLLATPLVRSIKRTWPNATVDVLVFEGTQAALAENPDIRHVLTVPERPGWLAHLGFIVRLLRRYDVALSTQHGDRPTLYAFLAGRWRAGLLVPTRKERWKRTLLQEWVPFDDINTHTVRMNLALADVIGATRCSDVVTAWSQDEERSARALLGPNDSRPYAMLHTYPKFNYKKWHVAAWAEIGHSLTARGMRVVLSGGGEAQELDYVGQVARAMPSGTINAAGRLTLGASASLASRAQVYVGPDTAMTHVAAALGVPTIALYGPSNCVKWGPWPKAHPADKNPWNRLGTQRRGNVILVQGPGACVPCHLEGCDRRLESYSDCLQQLSATRVNAAIEAILRA